MQQPKKAKEDKSSGSASLPTIAHLPAKKKKGKKVVKKPIGIRATRNRQAKFLEAYLQCGFNTLKAAQKAGISRRTVHHWRMNDEAFAEQFDDVREVFLDLAQEHAVKNIKAGDTATILFTLKTLGRKLGFTERDHPTSKKGNSILDEWVAGTLSAQEAAVRFYKLGIALPKVLELQLSKNEPLKPTGEDEKAPSIEEIERRAQEAFAAVQEQKSTFLPQRQQDVAELKERLKDQESFGPVENLEY